MKKIALMLTVLLMGGCAYTVPQAQFDRMNEQNQRCRAELKRVKALSPTGSKAVAAKKELDETLAVFGGMVAASMHAEMNMVVSVDVPEVFFDSTYKRAGVVMTFATGDKLTIRSSFIFIKKNGEWMMVASFIENEEELRSLMKYESPDEEPL